jgi:hypothetical protein
MTEIEKADQLYDYAVKLYGIDKAKEESLKSAQMTHSIAPSKDGKMLARSYWIRVIEHLKKK